MNFWKLYFLLCLFYVLPGGLGITLSKPPAALYLRIRLLQYPSAIKISPVVATATEVGLHKCLLSDPGINLTPNFSTGCNSPGLNCNVQRSLPDLNKTGKY